MLLYVPTIALSAFLLFLVEPMIAKMILPWFGGSAGVWTVALMFFQLTLLAGYVYAHATTRYLRPKTQALLHVILLALSLALLPIIPSHFWKSAATGDPTFRIFLLLAATVGLPYFMLSTTGPLLQAWYTGDRSPYRLFAVSNFGSMLGLISFPFLIEPALAARTQAITWSAAYAGFAMLCALIALRSTARKWIGSPEASDEPAPSNGLRLLWMALAACSSALLLAITNHMTKNVAPIPFLWVLTLAIYLASFIVCFQRDGTYRRIVFIPLLTIVLLGMSRALYTSDGNLPIKLVLPLFSAGLFVCCMVCHGELARLKPHPRYLTQYYLIVALGGALGGLFVAVIAPHIFTTYLELPISLISCAALTAFLLWNQTQRLVLQAVMAVFLTVLTGYLTFSEIEDRKFQITTVRNFYGVLRVTDHLDEGDITPVRKLVNGTIVHGEQLTNPGLRMQPTSYYGPESGVGRAILLLQQTQSSLRVGVVGLGAGVLAAYCRPTDVFRFYEINPLDVAIAKRYFTFLKDCAGDCGVSLGDARMTLENEPPQQFDVLAIDAFSSDSIPVHLLTREAFAQYFRHVKPGRILAVHVTNRYLDLVPVVARASEEMHEPAYVIPDSGNEADYFAQNDWMLLGPDTHLFVLLGFHGAPIIRRVAPKSLRTWTDDFSNLYQILK